MCTCAHKRRHRRITAFNRQEPQQSTSSYHTALNWNYWFLLIILVWKKLIKNIRVFKDEPLVPGLLEGPAMTSRGRDGTLVYLGLWPQSFFVRMGFAIDLQFL